MTEKKSRFADIAAMRARTVAEPEPQETSPPPSPVVKPGRPRGKSSDPAWSQVTVYLRTETHRGAQKLLFDERKQFSDLVEELVSDWINQKSRLS